MTFAMYKKRWPKDDASGPLFISYQITAAYAWKSFTRETESAPTGQRSLTRSLRLATRTDITSLRVTSPLAISIDTLLSIGSR